MSGLSPSFRAILAMLAAVGCFSLMDAALKGLTGSYPPLQVAALRGLAAFPLVCAYIAWQVPLRTLVQVRWPMHLLRGVLNVGMLCSFSLGIGHLAIAEAYTLFFISPLVVTALAVPLLKEPARRAHWIAIGIGLCGVLIAMRPGGDSMVSWGALAILVSSLCYSGTVLTARIITRTEGTASVVFWTTFFMAAGASVLALPDWQPVQTIHWPMIAAMGLSGFGGTVAITYAFKHGKTASVAPFEYSALAWAIAIDYLIWNTTPDAYTLVGGCIVILSGLYLIRDERGQAAEAAKLAQHP